jgi:ribosomal protein L32E
LLWGAEGEKGPRFIAAMGWHDARAVRALEPKGQQDFLQRVTLRSRWSSAMRVSLKEYRRERWDRYWHGPKKPHDVESMTEKEFDTEVDKLIRGEDDEKK